MSTTEKVSWSYQEHAESFPHDAVEEVEGRVSGHHEEVGEEEELPAAVVQQSVVLAAEQRLIGILREEHMGLLQTQHLVSQFDLDSCQHDSVSNELHLVHSTKDILKYSELTKQ